MSDDWAPGFDYFQRKTERFWDKRFDGDEAYIEAYITDLLPAELDYAKRKGSITIPSVWRSGEGRLVLTVGYSWEPLLQSLCVYKPIEVVLILSDNYGNSRAEDKQITFEWAAKRLAERKLIPAVPQISSIIIQTISSTGDVFHQLQEYFQNQQDLDSTLIDITGGKKSTVAGCYLFAATYSSLGVTYVDFDEFNLERGRPYGFTCRINAVENPYQTFQLRQWEHIEEAYKKHGFRSAKEQLEAVKSALEGLGERFRSESDAVTHLQHALDMYEAWDNGDYHTAYQRHSRLPDNPVPDAVRVLGPDWPSPPSNTGRQAPKIKTIGDELLRNVKLYLGEKGNDLKSSLYLRPQQLMAYAWDEIAKVGRLIALREDYRSALLRAAGLCDTLLRARIVGLWAKERIGLKELRGNGPTQTRSQLSDPKREQEAVVGLSQISETYDFLVGRSNHIKNHRHKVQVVWASDNEPLRMRDWATHNNQTSCEPPDTPCLDLRRQRADITGVVGGHWQPLDFSTLIGLRNKAIHTCLSVNRSLAAAAFHVTLANVCDFAEQWAPLSGLSTHDHIETGVPEFDDLCRTCGIKLRPRTSKPRPGE